MNTLITVALFQLFSPMLGYMLAYSVVYLFGIALAYALNTAFVFKVSKSWSSAALYPLVYAATYVYGLVMMIIVVDHFGFNEMLALTLVILSSVPINYFLTRTLFNSFPPRKP